MLSLQLGSRVRVGVQYGVVTAIDELSGKPLKVKLDNDGPVWSRPERYYVVPQDEFPVDDSPQSKPEEVPAPEPKSKKVPVIPDVISPELVEYIKSTGARPRLFWPIALDGEMRELFAALGIAEATKNIQPIESGKKGGKTRQRTLAGELKLPSPQPGIISISRADVLVNELIGFGASINWNSPGVTKVSRVRFILGLIVAGIAPVGKGVK